MTDRERFEAWLAERDSEEAIQKDAQGVYGYWDTRQSWDAWQASRKQALEDAAYVSEQKSQRAADGDEIAEAIRALANPEGEQG